MDAPHYQPGDDCPEGRKEPPCPLYGGPVPPIEWGPAGSFGGDDDFPTALSSDEFGRCRVCDAIVMFDDDGKPLLARRSR